MLENIGFYTLCDERADNVNIDSPLWRAEMLLTDRCNFKCPYCRGPAEGQKGDVSRNIRFSGGEPTMWPDLVQLIAYSRSRNIERIALSTNGSAKQELYRSLFDAGVNDFSISLDACCAETGDMMAGNKKGSWKRVVSNIEFLSKLTYVTVGIVLTPDNMQEFYDIVSFADKLGVADIRIVTSAQWNHKLGQIVIQEDILSRHPILRYRIDNFNNGRNMRGIQAHDSNKCPLVIDDIAVLNGYHYPCIIYLREHGKPIGKMTDDFRQQRFDWFVGHDTHSDQICSKNCIDVCQDYNNKAMKTRKQDSFDV